MMNKFGRRVLAAATIAVAAIGLGTAHAASAPTRADGEVPDTQNVTVIKYKSDATPTAQDPTKGPDETNPKELVDGAAYDVYDVTTQYWEKMADPDINKDNIGDVYGSGDNATDAKNFDVSKLTPITTITTNGAQGSDDLPTKSSDGRGAVYLFRESSTPQGYSKSADFLLGMPYAASDGSYPANLYVYPKDAVLDHYFLKFKKVDKFNTTTTLVDAEFEITRTTDGQTLYAVVDSKPAVSGFDATPQQITWVADKDQGTKFTSDNDGLFGVAGDPESHIGTVIKGLSTSATYGVVETKAPKGYTTDFNYVGGKVQVGDAKDANADGTLNLIGDKPENVLPHTGGRGILIMVVAGIALVAVGMIAYNKRRNANA